MFAYNLCAGLLRAIGNSFMPLVFLVLSSVLNVILDLWFIAVLGMGVAGAGVATVISQGVSVAFCILYVFRSARLLLPEKKHFHVESRLYWELFSQSISMGLMSSIVSAGSVVLQYGINGLGTLVIAGHTAARKLFAFTDMPLSAMASASSTYVSQNYGANHPDRVRRGMREIYLYSVVVAVAAVLLMAAGAEWMVKLVSGSSEPVVLENGIRISGAPIHEGHVVWSEDLSPLMKVLDELKEAKENLEDSNGLLEEENAVKAREAHVAEQERLYSIIQRETAPQIRLMDELIDQAQHAETEEKCVWLLRKMLVIGAYLKRRSNLVFLADKMSILEAKEISLTFGESMDNLEMCGIICGFCLELTESVLAVHIMEMYDFFEKVTERSLDRMSSLTVYVGQTAEGLSLIINTDSAADLSDLASDTVQICRDEDSEWKLTLNLGMGGDEQ